MAVKVTLDELRIGQIARAQVMPVVGQVAAFARDEIKAVIDESDPSGRVYTIAGTGGQRYRASARGEPPAKRKGEYRDAWESTPAVQERRRIVARVFNPIRVGRKRTPLWAILNFGFGRTHIEPAMERAAVRSRRMLAGR